VAQSIRSFPRGKLVFDQPLELPISGKLWLEESTKEELLSKWMRIVRREQLPIDEGRRMTGVEPLGDGFRVTTSAADDDGHDRVYQACRVLLAIGRRGSPRKLPAPLDAEVEGKVFYHLADARSIAGRRALVVGLGDVAMEAAISLARQPDTEVTVSYRGKGFQRGKDRNVAEMKRLVAAGRVRLVEQSTVTTVAPQQVELQTPDGKQMLDNDVVFVMIGSVPPHELLSRVGVRIETARSSVSHDDAETPL
jgi:thioredoxin reductase